MTEIPNPLTLEEIISQGGIEGSEEAYDKEDGFDYSGPDCALLYYGGDEFSGGTPFTGLYYELYENGKLESYSMYKNGMPVGGSYTFYENGKIKSYRFFSKDRLNNYCYYYDEIGNLERSDIWKDGRFMQKVGLQDNIFDGFEYCGAWFKKIRSTFAGTCVDVDVQINGYDEEEIPAKGKAVLSSFLSNVNKLTPTIAEAVFEYYRDRREELGYDIENNSDYPDLKDPEQILDTLQLIGITVPDQDEYSEPAIFLVFNCNWDKENGVGVCLVGDVIEEVGTQGIAL